MAKFLAIQGNLKLVLNSWPACNAGNISVRQHAYRRKSQTKGKTGITKYRTISCEIIKKFSLRKITYAGKQPALVKVLLRPESDNFDNLFSTKAVLAVEKWFSLIASIPL